MMEDVTIEAIKAVDDINRTVPVYMIGYSCYNVRCIFSDSGGSRFREGHGANQKHPSPFTL